MAYRRGLGRSLDSDVNISELTASAEDPGVLQEAGMVARDYAGRIVLWAVLAGVLVASLGPLTDRLFPEG